MLGIQTLMGTGLGTVFTYVCVGVAVVAIAYVLYKAYMSRRRERTPNEFQENNRDRQQREQRITAHADNALELQHDAQQILTRVHNQQQQFGAILTDFDRMLADIQSTNSSVDQANRTLQDTVIDSIISLLGKMKTEYQQMSTLLTTLSSALDHTNRTFATREKEINLVVSNLQAIEASANQSIQMVVSEWPAISHIQKMLYRKIEKNTELEKINQALKESLRESAATNAQLSERLAELIDITERQRSLLNMIGPTENQEPSSENCRHTSPVDYKLFSQQGGIPSNKSGDYSNVTIRRKQ